MTRASDIRIAWSPPGVRGVRALFDASAATYDRVNTIVSFGLDRRWRRWAAARAVGDGVRPRVLDAFAGTGLSGLAAARLGARVTMADDSQGMLGLAVDRATARGIPIRACLVDLTDAETVASLGSFDACTVVFGVRYLDDPVAVLRALGALLEPGGRLVVMDFCTPDARPLHRLAGAYFFGVLPSFAGLLAGDVELYRTLSVSTRRLGGRDRLPALVAEAGLHVTEVALMGFGLVVGVVGTRG